MLLDKLTLLADSLAYDGTPEVYDFGVAAPCKSDTYEIFISGEGDVAGATTVTVNTAGTAACGTTIGTVVFTAAALNAAPQRVPIPSNCEQFVTIAITGATAGTLNAGIIATVQANT